MTVGQQFISWSLSITPQKAEVQKSTLWVEKITANACAETRPSDGTT